MSRIGGLTRIALVVLVAMVAAACATKRGNIPTGVTEPDKYLYEQGTAAMADKKWFTAREYFQQLVDSYPQSPLRADAKLGLGDAYLNDGSTEGKLRAEREFQEFLSYFPTHQRADYAQYKLAMTHFDQMPKAGARSDRDTRRAGPVRGVPPEVPQQRADARGAREGARRARSPERVHLQGGLLLPQGALVSGRHLAVPAGAAGGPAVHQPRRGLLLPGRGAGHGEARGRGAAAAREARGGIRRERVPGTGGGTQGARPGDAVLADAGHA